MKGKKKKIIIVVVVLAVLAVTLKVVMGKNSKPVGNMVTTGAVEQKSIDEILSLKAPLEGTESVEVVSKLHYEITSIGVKEGDKVTKGQVIAELDPKTLQEEIEKLQDNLELLRIQYRESNSTRSQGVTSAEIKLADALEESQREYDAAVEALSSAKKDFETAKTLYSAGGETKAVLDETENKFNQAQRAVDAFTVKDGKVVASQAQINEINSAKTSNNAASSSKSIQIAEKELARKKAELEECHVKSSIDGTITRVNAKVGRFADEIGTDIPMFVIENIDTLKMNVQVSEYNIGKVAIGQSVNIGADILKDKTVSGVVSRISPTGEEKNGTTERFIPIQIDIKGENSGLIAGINATAKIQVAKADNAMVVPVEAVLDNGDDTYSVLRVKADNTIEVLPVTLGVESALEIQLISDSLAEGDKIVLGPTADLTDGTSVIVNE